MNSQFKKGVLDLCVLTILAKGDSYGYDVADTLSGKIQMSDGTVYPILRKLASDGYVSTYLKESQNVVRTRRVFRTHLIWPPHFTRKLRQTGEMN
jgi:DNA-binding PadR family transcriptional regulator